MRIAEAGRDHSLSRNSEERQSLSLSKKILSRCEIALEITKVYMFRGVKEPAILVKMTVEFNVYQKVTDYTGNVTPPKSIHVYDYVASILGVLLPR